MAIVIGASLLHTVRQLATSAELAQVDAAVRNGDILVSPTPESGITVIDEPWGTDFIDQSVGPGWSAGYPGLITAQATAAGPPLITLTCAGPMLVAPDLVRDADPQWLAVVGDVITFRGVEDQGRPVSYRYRITGRRDGWLLTRPCCPPNCDFPLGDNVIIRNERRGHVHEIRPMP